MNAFKSYDIRGVFGKEWNLTTAYRIGRCLPTVLKAQRFLVGRDCRESSPAIRDALILGLIDAGASVDDTGFATTPMVYFFTAEHAYDASVQITASHNPPDHNGLKVSKRGALPVGYDAGLNQVEAMVDADDLPPKAAVSGTVTIVDLLPAYIDWLRQKKSDLSGLRFAVDCSDGMGSLVARALFGDQAIYLNDTPDGRFPHHQPNPLEVENCAQLMAVVREHQLDIGVIYDGDADRVMFVDQEGSFIQPDYLIPIIAKALQPGEPKPMTVIHDIRTSLGVIETLHEAGMETVMGKVGHAYAKIALRETGACCGGELAGHYYFRDFHYCDSGEWASLVILGAVAEAKRSGQTFKALMAPIISRYYNSGELNFRGIDDKEGAMKAVCHAIRQTLGEPEAEYTFDGVRMAYPTAWMNVRPSNTEPCLRLLLEARDLDTLTTMRKAAEVALQPYS